jgi:oxygen-independent coproporphyrinogen-3 oxidase
LASTTDLGIYVHVPFCERVCPYCDFAVIAVGRLDPERERGYLECLLRELEGLWRAHEAALAGRTLASVYLGGGTPGLLRPASVERLLRALEDRFGGPAAEVTLELNPGPLEVDRAPGFRDVGVTRLSVGVQSFRDLTLKRLGRAQRGDHARRGLEACLAAGFASLSADLIYGAPEQNEDELLEDLERLIALGVPHVSAYALSIEPGTPFATGRERGQLRLPDEEVVARMGRRLRAGLARAGYGQYEISSFARRGHRSSHNQRYWQCLDVLGLGVSAASLLGRRRFQNTRDPVRWADALAAGRSPVAEGHQISEEEARADFLGLGFRQLAVSRAEFLRRFGSRPETCFGPELAELRQLGLIFDAGGYLRLTERGLAFADDVFLRFVGR